LKLEKIKHGFKTLAECGGIRGVDDTSIFVCFWPPEQFFSYLAVVTITGDRAANFDL
jgi:hypothetical protein